MWHVLVANVDKVKFNFYDTRTQVDFVIKDNVTSWIMWQYATYMWHIGFCDVLDSVTTLTVPIVNSGTGIIGLIDSELVTYWILWLLSLFPFTTLVKALLDFMIFWFCDIMDSLTALPILFVYTVFASLANILPKSNSWPLPASLCKSPHFTQKCCTLVLWSYLILRHIGFCDCLVPVLGYRPYWILWLPRDSKSHKAKLPEWTMGMGKAITESNKSQNNIDTKFDKSCRLALSDSVTYWICDCLVTILG